MQMGRYSDLYHQEEKYHLWEQSNKYFENKKYIASHQCFFDFLKRQEVDNIQYKLSKGQLSFKLSQGSMIIEGVVDHEHFKAYAKIINLATPDIKLMQEALVSNYKLEYSRYALDKDNNLLLIFDSFIEDATPQKVYNGLKELACLADKRDDVLLSKYGYQSAINMEHIRQISDNEKKIKFKFFKSEIEKLSQELQEYEALYRRYPGALTYQILGLFYKIDFLLKPEGIILESTRYIHDLHTKNHYMNIHKKNDSMMQIVNTLSNMTFENFEKELYEVISTFGDAQSVKNEKIKNLINLHFEEAQWYYSNGFESCALAIWDYVVGFVLYSYVLPKPLEDLFVLYYQVRHHNFFKDLGYKNDFYFKNSTLNLKKIKSEIKAIINQNKVNYSSLSFNHKLLKSGNIFIFTGSFLSAIIDCNIPEKRINSY